MMRAVGVEPTTLALKVRYSTTELRPLANNVPCLSSQINWPFSPTLMFLIAEKGDTLSCRDKGWM